MAEKGEKLTPMMRQYMEIKEKHQDMVLFFRLGDFYEMFGDDAIEVSKLLNLTLTKRVTMPMCGIPYHAVRNYLRRLLDAGKKVAICEQLSLPDKAGEIAEREVTEIFTPATVVDDDYLDSLSSSFVLAVNEDRKGLYLAWSDVSAGSFYVRTLPPEKDLSGLESVLSSVSPKEIAVSDDLYFMEKRLRSILDNSGAMVTKLPSWYFSLREGRKETEAQFPPSALESFGIGSDDMVLTASGALLRYIRDNMKADLPQLRGIERIGDGSFLSLNAAAVRNLELIAPLNGGRDGSLFHAINRTRTASGARFMKDQILHPLCDRAAIEERLGWVGRFVDDGKELSRVRNILSSASDLERLSTKASMRRTTPRDLISIADTIASFFELVSEREEYLALAPSFEDSFSELISFSDEVTRAINRECTNLNNPGTIILDGYDQDLDRERALMSSGTAVLDDYVSRIREETGIQTMRTGENRIIGAFIEVSKGQLDKVPDYFIRRQTLVGGERFTTPELEEIKGRISSAESNASSLEREIFQRFSDRAFSIYDEISRMGRILSLLDYYSSLAFLARECGYTRPELIDDGDIVIEDGRHPVVESFTGRAEYVSNSFSSEPSRFSLITGPNMAGKSTYLRQIAIITLMAHMGSFVPASRAVIPLTDKIFCRVGASDNLSRGESTFLVEMSETAMILRSATRRSLVIMDEIGRGTSTEDGMSIAFAVMEYMKKLGAITLFATHYHELTMLDTSGIQLLHMAVREERSTITFLRKAEPGVSASSYGIHVAKLAGLPKEVVRDAAQFQRRHFADYSFDTSQGDLFIDNEPVREPGTEEEVIDDIMAFDTDSSTPLEALMFINGLKGKLERRPVDTDRHI